MSSRPTTDTPPAVSRPHAVDTLSERRATEGAAKAHHFNAAGAALPTRATVEAVVSHLRREEEVGGYEAAASARDRVEAVYDSAAALIGARREEIAMFDSATTGLRVLVDALRIAPGSRILVSRSTYVSHALHLMSIARERGISLEILPVDGSRCVDLESLESLLAGGPPAIVSVAHIPTSSGIVEPAAQIGALVATHGGTFLLDATQSVGHLRTNVVDIGCDVLVTTGRKFLRGPRGTGFAYVKSDLVERLTPTAPDVRGSHWYAPLDWELDASARRFESWEASIAGRLGLGNALDEARARGVAPAEDWFVAQGDLLRRSLAEIPGTTVTDPGNPRSALVTFVIDGVAPADAVTALAERSVRVVSVPASHGQWDIGDRGVPSVVRASPHVYNDEADVAALLSAVAAVAGGGAA
ncbi:aminotransferase class V-fold PLP-dependent enzyme [Microbacterium sediminicola]|uniref:Aminotransferase class V-fold PLP-dependent enzyme n=1 Tax=Microbacterium sediminicola TaxID=415210 RepID=A0ABP4THF8_9MICO